METESTWAYTTRMRKLMRRSQIVVDEKARALSEKYNNPNNRSTTKKHQV